MNENLPVPAPPHISQAEARLKDSQHSGIVGALSTAIDPMSLPTAILRVGQKGRTWGMPRRFATYRAVSYELLSVRGAAPKCIIRSEHDPNDWYIAKSSEAWDKIETITELLNNLLGQRLGFPMAHAGLLYADGELRFASHNFLEENESLIHGSVLFQGAFNDDLADVGKNNWDEQRTFDIELIHAVLHEKCGDTAVEELFAHLVEMLVFDALIGSMDRHMQNWGVIASVSEPRTYRFAPIFDSARALLWDYDESKLKTLLTNRAALEGYINRSRPKIGCAKIGHVNHFGLIRHLITKYPGPTREALSKIEPNKVSAASKIVREFPFHRFFSPERKKIVRHVLALRADTLNQIAREGR